MIETLLIISIIFLLLSAFGLVAFGGDSLLVSLISFPILIFSIIGITYSVSQINDGVEKMDGQCKEHCNGLGFFDYEVNYIDDGYVCDCTDCLKEHRKVLRREED